MTDLLTTYSGDFVVTLSKVPSKKNPERVNYLVKVTLGDCELCHYWLTDVQRQLIDYYLTLKNVGTK